MYSEADFTRDDALAAAYDAGEREREQECEREDLIAEEREIDLVALANEWARAQWRRI